MLFAATQMELEEIMLSDVSKKIKGNYQMVSHTCGIMNSNEKIQHNKKPHRELFFKNGGVREERGR